MPILIGGKKNCLWTTPLKIRAHDRHRCRLNHQGSNLCDHQRGHAGPSVAALGANQALPLSPDPRRGCLISGKGAAAPLPSPWVTPRLRHRAETR